MTGMELLAAALALVAGSLMQGTVGFAAGIVAIPLLLFSGFSLPQAVAINGVGSFIQSVYAVYHLRREIVYRDAIRPIVARMLLIPVGVGVLGLADQLDQRQVRQVVGVVMLVLLILQLAWRRSSQGSWPAWLEWLAFCSSGFLLGFCGIGGPPLVMWVASHKWPPAQARGLLFFIFSISLIPQTGVLLWRFGGGVGSAMLMGLAGAPLVLVGGHFGLLAGRRLSAASLRAAMFVMLFIMAVYEISAPWQP
jgi:uncharacterized membrane protein YfcA